jgi:hypothetical protein
LFGFLEQADRQEGEPRYPDDGARPRCGAVADGGEEDAREDDQRDRG